MWNDCTEIIHCIAWNIEESSFHWTTKLTSKLTTYLQTLKLYIFEIKEILTIYNYRTLPVLLNTLNTREKISSHW